MVLSKTQKYEYLDKLLHCRELEGNAEYQRLLAYLVKNTIEGHSLKEYTIGIEFFKKDASFNPTDDNSVRYRIYKLRDKIRRYYEYEGKDDPVKLIIPKGHYFVQFSEKDINHRIQHPPEYKIRYWRKFALGALAACVVLVAVLIILMFTSHRIVDPIPSNDKIWSTFFDNTLPLVLLIGDNLIFHEFDEQLGYNRRIMDYRINTFAAMRQYQESFTQRKIDQLYVSGEAPHYGIRNITDLMHVFYSFNKTFDINWTSETTVNGLKDRNIIYIGEFKNMRAMQSVLSLTSFQIRNLVGSPILFEIENADTSKNHSFRFSPHVARGEENVDYGFIAKVPGMRNEQYLIIAGFEYASQVELVQLLSRSEMLNELEENIKTELGHIPPYFEILFEVTGYGIINYNSEIIFIDEIDPKEFHQRALQALRDQEMLR